MMQVFNSGLPVIVIHQDSTYPNLNNVSDRIVFKKQYRSIILSVVDSKSMPADLGLDNESSLKVLDKFYLLFDKSEYLSNKLVQDFFDFISNHYSELIDVNFNLTNIRFLVNELLGVITKPKPLVLDFGCGIGLSNSIKTEFDKKGKEMELLGYDLSAHMLKIAKHSGMRTLNERAFSKINDNYFDGVLASYVMHFVHDTSIINELWKKIKIGGFLIANFHKNIGVERILPVIQKLNGKIKHIGHFQNGEVYLFSKEIEPFTSEADISKYLTEHFRIDPQVISILLSNNVITEFNYNEEKYVLKPDLESFFTFFQDVQNSGWESAVGNLYEKAFFIQTPSLKITFNRIGKNNLDPAMLSLLRNIMLNYKSDSEMEVLSYEEELNGIIKIESRNSNTNKYIKDHLNIIREIDNSRASIFSNSASYMGSKRFLRSFILESIFPHVKNEQVFFDLMCGSGAISGTASFFWETIASDAMRFCRILAKAQGGGYSITDANRISEFIIEKSEENLVKLKALFSNELSIEDKIFHSQISEALIQEYDTFSKTFPAIDEKHSLSNKLYHKEKDVPNIYCLFTCAYSNLYLGVRQAMELDSCRSAIEQIENKADKDFALGALIATLSAVGNSYGGHFAQPKYKEINRLSVNDFFKLIEQRNISIINDFAVRIRELALESQLNKGFRVDEIAGPWVKALEEYPKTKWSKQKTIVYLDAPYTRDEYSRYYHLLETLVNYDYADFGGIGRVPSKKTGRFSSDFFTKNVSKLKGVYVGILETILKQGFECAWSYSDNATIPCAEILNELNNRVKYNAIAYSTPYTHQAQGGRKAKRIKEYLIILKTRDNVV